jgi:methylated-DNA-[protein]-cysteine S-methyltransferase
MAKAPEPICLLRDELDSPLGRLVVITEETGAVRLIAWLEDHPKLEPVLRGYASDPRYELRAADDPGGVTGAVRDYFAGDLAALDRLEVAEGGTPFQRQVWRALRDIARGSTLSYGELARRIGQPRAVRAVGLANGQNPVNLVVPCHRVIGADGSLTGYGGGLRRKRWLLAHERATPGLELPLGVPAA